MNLKKLTIYLLSLCCCLSLSACSSLTKFVNYTDKLLPRFAFLGHAKTDPHFDNKIKVVSYNVKHSKKIDEALSILKHKKELSDADIILLQEMTIDGVVKLAESLQYDYIFYPAVHHPI